MHRCTARVASLLFCTTLPLAVVASHAQGSRTGSPAAAVSSSSPATGTPAISSGRKATPPRKPSSRGNANATGSAAANPASGRGPASQDSPLLPISTLTNSLGIASGTPIQVQLNTTVDSAHARNGDTLAGSLAAPLAGMPVGTPVTMTVISASSAGSVQSYGELSIQVLSVGNHPLLSNVVSAVGQEGKRELPDAAPAKGTEASFSAERPLTLTAA